MKQIIIGILFTVFNATAYSNDDGQLNLFVEFESSNLFNPPFVAPQETFFNYYTASEIDDQIIREQKAEMNILRRVQYRTNAFFGKDAFQALPSDWHKLDYIARLEKKRRASGKGESCWSGRTCQLLIKTKNAPALLAKHPNFEMPPSFKPQSDAEKFAFPELTTGRETPATSIFAASNLIEHIVTRSTFKNVHVHAFFRLPLDGAEDQIRRLSRHVDTENRFIYMQSGAEGQDFLFSHFLHPWTEEKANTLLEEVRSRTPKSLESNPESHPKYSFLAIRYWGVENDQHVFSLELRRVPIKSLTIPSKGHGFEEGKLPEVRWFFDEARRAIGRIAEMAKLTELGQLPDVSTPSIRYDLKLADKMIREHANRKGISNPVLLSELANKTDSSGVNPFVSSETGRIYPGIMAPFAVDLNGEAPFLDESFLNRYLEVTSVMQNSQISDSAPILFRNAYFEWMKEKAPKVLNSTESVRETRKKALLNSSWSSKNCFSIQKS